MSCSCQAFNNLAPAIEGPESLAAGSKLISQESAGKPELWLNEQRGVDVWRTVPGEGHDLSPAEGVAHHRRLVDSDILGIERRVRGKFLDHQSVSRVDAAWVRVDRCVDTGARQYTFDVPGGSRGDDNQLPSCPFEQPRGLRKLGIRFAGRSAILRAPPRQSAHKRSKTPSPGSV